MDIADKGDVGSPAVRAPACDADIEDVVGEPPGRAPRLRAEGLKCPHFGQAYSTRILLVMMRHADVGEVKEERRRRREGIER